MEINCILTCKFAASTHRPSAVEALHADLQLLSPQIHSSLWRRCFAGPEGKEMKEFEPQRVALSLQNYDVDTDRPALYSMCHQCYKQ